MGIKTIDLGYVPDEIIIREFHIDRLSRRGRFVLSLGYTPPEDPNGWVEKASREFEFGDMELEEFFRSGTMDFSQLMAVLSDIQTNGANLYSVDSLLVSILYPFVEFMLKNNLWEF